MPPKTTNKTGMKGKTPEQVPKGKTQKSPEQVRKGQSPVKVLKGKSPEKVLTGQSPVKVLKGQSPEQVKKGKSSAVVDGLSTAQMSMGQLQQHNIRLREELEKEREQRNYFQIERDNIHGFWEITKRNLDEAKAELKNQSREIEEAEERHRVEITVFQQKVKHILYEQHNAISGLKIDNVASTSLIQDQHMESELELRREVQGLQFDLIEQQLQNENCIKELKLKHQVELMELTNDYDRRVTEMEVKYHKKMLTTVEAENNKRKAQVFEIEDSMKRHISSLIEDQDKAVEEADVYNTAIQAKLLADQDKLKEELAEAAKQQTRVDKKRLAVEQENKRLRESLQETQQKLPELQRRQEEYKQAKANMTVTRARVKVIEKDLNELKVEHELLQQAFEKVQQERDALLKQQMKAILDVQQRRAKKELMLEKNLAVLTETVEKKEAQLCASTVGRTSGSKAANKLRPSNNNKTNRR